MRLGEGGKMRGRRRKFPTFSLGHDAFLCQPKGFELSAQDGGQRPCRPQGGPGGLSLQDLKAQFPRVRKATSQGHISSTFPVLPCGGHHPSTDFYLLPCAPTLLCMRASTVVHPQPHTSKTRCCLGRWGGVGEFHQPSSSTLQEKREVADFSI